jgi:nucleoside-diphosphate-sugar epimerase
MDFQGRRVFIIGATGFLGGALARALAQGGAEVHALARPTSDRSSLDGIPVTWHMGDITASDTLNQSFADAEWIIHAAGPLGKPNVTAQVYHRVHVDGTRNVLTAVQAQGSRVKVLYLSSPGVLGQTTREPAPEDAPLAPTNPYERSKAAGEQVARDFAARGVAVVIARPGFVYGPGDRHVLGLFRAIRRGQFFYIGSGCHLCQPTFIADAVVGMLLCLTWGRAGEVYHIAGPSSVTFRELGETIASALGVRPPWLSLPRWAAMMGATTLEIGGWLTRRVSPLTRTGVAFFSEDRVFSIAKACRELGYLPGYDLAKGVAHTVAWYRQQGWL